MGKTVGIALITRNAENSIANCINSFKDHVDQVVVVLAGKSTDKTEEIIRTIPKVEVYEWLEDIDEPTGEINDFAAARNFSFSKLNTDYYMWLDSDDELVNPEKIRGVIEKTYGKFGGIWFPYYYAFDEFNNVTVVYERERILDSRYQWVWQNRIHETVSPMQPCEYIRTKELYNKHNHRAGASRSNRNFRLLNMMLKEQPSNLRIYLYLAHQYMASEHWDEAAEWYLKFATNLQSLPIERYQALCYCSKALRAINDRQALEVALMAIELYPQYRDAYLELAHSYFMIGDVDKALFWANMSDIKEMIQDPPAVIFINPLDYTFNKWLLCAECYLRKEDIDTAMRFLKQCYSQRPVPDLKERMLLLRDVKVRKEAVYGLKALMVELLNTRELARLQKIPEIAPVWYRDMSEYNDTIEALKQYIPEEKPEVEIIDGVTRIDASTTNELQEIIDKIDKGTVEITVPQPKPDDKKQVAAYCQYDLEKILTSKSDRHLLQLHRTEEANIFCQYDHRLPEGLLIRLFSGPGLEDWSPWTIEKLGSGGSELSAAFMAQELTKLDNLVFLYAMNYEVWDGVIYRPWQRYEGTSCDLFISSRMPDIFNRPIEAKQKWLWVHDVHCGDRLTPEVAEQLDAIIVLSKWHLDYMRKTYPFLQDCEVLDFEQRPRTYEDSPETAVFYQDARLRHKPKFAIISDAINVERYREATEKHKHRFIWASSPDRGLEQLLQIWSIIHKEWNDAELHIFYGWVYFDRWHSNNPVMMEWKRKIMKLMRQDGVINHGRVGQGEMAKEWLKSDIWLYPPPHDFRETCCISSIEAQASGVLCYYRMNGALGETIGDRGHPIPLTATPQQLVAYILSTAEKSAIIRKRAKEWAMTQSWQSKAKMFLDLYNKIAQDK